MKKYIFLLSFFCCFGIFTLSAQSYAFGVKGGLTAATQRWNNFDDGQPLLSYHGDIYIESWNEDNLSALFASVGYHARGRTMRTRRTVGLNGEDYPSRTFDQKLFNGVLIIGVKKKIPVKKENIKGFYGFGVRGEYNIKTDLGIYDGFNDSVNKITYGVTVNGGFEFMFSEFVGGVFEISVHPDFGKQIFVPPIPNYIDPYSGVRRTLPEQNIVNTSIEISVGFRFLRKITYID